ncbi:hypothetical protein [Pseudomonas sp. ERMR1:02]|nr:hypothetical protein [Pseudomonas sp. ERMR1:02]
MRDVPQARGLFSEFALKIDGQMAVLAIGHYLSRPALFKKDIESRLTK